MGLILLTVRGCPGRAASLSAAFYCSFISEEIGDQWSPHHGHIHKMDVPETSQGLSFPQVSPQYVEDGCLVVTLHLPASYF